MVKYNHAKLCNCTSKLGILVALPTSKCVSVYPKHSTWLMVIKPRTAKQFSGAAVADLRIYLQVSPKFWKWQMPSSTAILAKCKVSRGATEKQI